MIDVQIRWKTADNGQPERQKQREQQITPETIASF